MAKKKEAPAYTPPASMEAEQAVLGAILVRPEVLDDVSPIIEPDDFYREAHALIYRVMIWLQNNNEAVDLVTVSTRLSEAGALEMVGGPVFLAQLSEQVGFSTNAVQYARVVRRKATQRRLLDASQEIASKCLAPVDDIDALLRESEEKIFSIMEDKEAQAICFSLDELVPEESEYIEQIYGRKQEIVGVPSGFVDLDALTGGFQNSDLILLAARPSMGKTALSLNMGFYAAKNYGVPTAFFSLEQPRRQIVQRLMASQGTIDGNRLRTAKLNLDEWGRFAEVGGYLLDTPFYIIDKAAMTLSEIRSQARRLKIRFGLRFIILDYLQLARATGGKREQEIGNISRGLKSIAKDLDLPFVALTQLNREVEKRPNKRPMLSDLRESGSLEQDADLVIFIYRDEVYKESSPDTGIAEINIAKQRNGPPGRIKLTYRQEFMLFQNYIREDL